MNPNITALSNGSRLINTTLGLLLPFLSLSSLRATSPTKFDSGSNGGARPCLGMNDPFNLARQISVALNPNKLGRRVSASW